MNASGRPPIPRDVTWTPWTLYTSLPFDGANPHLDHLAKLAEKGKQIQPQNKDPARSKKEALNIYIRKWLTFG